MNKLKVYKILLVLLILAVIAVATCVFIKYYEMYKTEKAAQEVIQSITTKVEESPDEPVVLIDEQIKGNKVVGIIRIPKINIEYPILETTTVDTLNISITKFWGNEINEIGNVTLAGHNNLNGTMFGKVKKLKNGDIIELTDIQNNTVEYEIFKMYIIDPNDISCILPVEEGTREVTLITCTATGEQRLIVKAREIAE